MAFVVLVQPLRVEEVDVRDCCMRDFDVDVFWRGSRRGRDRGRQDGREVRCEAGDLDCLHGVCGMY